MQVRSLMFTWSLTQNIVLATEALEQAGVAALCGSVAKPVAASTTTQLVHRFGWLVGLSRLLLSIPMWQHTYEVLTKQLPTALSSRKGEEDRHEAVG